MQQLPCNAECATFLAWPSPSRQKGYAQIKSISFKQIDLTQEQIDDTKHRRNQQ